MRAVLWVVVLVVVLVAAAGVLGLLLQRRLFRGADPDSTSVRAESLPVAELVIPARILVALVLAFVLVQTFSSYQDASDHASAEAGAVLTEADFAALLAPAVARPMVRSLRCYAGSVAGPEWRSLKDSRQGSRETDTASRRVDRALAAAERARPDPTVMTAVLRADELRLEARRGRLAEAEPSVPGVVTVLMVGGAMVILGGMSALASPSVRPRLQVALVVTTGLVFAATLVVILDVDRPFGGLASIEPTAMRGAERRIAELPLAADPGCAARA